MLPTIEDDSPKGPLFIVSMWRAGSSLLFALLNQHPQVKLMYEADLPLLTPVFLKPSPLRDWPERWDFWNSALTRHGVKPSDAPADASFQSAFQTVHQGFASARGATIWGDKSPNYYDRMTWLAQKFPGARFIVVWRNPADTARSMVRAAATGSSYFQKRGVLLRALIGYRVFRKQYVALKRAGIPVHAIDYEDLTRNTETTMRGVCDFLQIPFDPRILSLENADRSSIYEGEHHSFVKGNEIRSGQKRPEVLDPAWKYKIDRYVRSWQQQDHGWPAYPKLECENGSGSWAAERLADTLHYQTWKLFDQFTAAVFSFAPLELLQRYRGRRKPGTVA
jgi:Sulfotransferase family